MKFLNLLLTSLLLASCAQAAPAEQAPAVAEVRSCAQSLTEMLDHFEPQFGKPVVTPIEYGVLYVWSRQASANTKETIAVAATYSQSMMMYLVENGFGEVVGEACVTEDGKKIRFFIAGQVEQTPI